MFIFTASDEDDETAILVTSLKLHKDITIRIGDCNPNGWVLHIDDLGLTVDQFRTVYRQLLDRMGSPELSTVSLDDIHETVELLTRNNI